MALWALCVICQSKHIRACGSHSERICTPAAQAGVSHTGLHRQGPVSKSKRTWGYSAQEEATRQRTQVMHVARGQRPVGVIFAVHHPSLHIRMPPSPPPPLHLTMHCSLRPLPLCLIISPCFAPLYTYSLLTLYTYLPFAHTPLSLCLIISSSHLGLHPYTPTLCSHSTSASPLLTHPYLCASYLIISTCFAHTQPYLCALSQMARIDKRHRSFTNQLPLCQSITSINQSITSVPRHA